MRKLKLQPTRGFLLCWLTLLIRHLYFYLSLKNNSADGMLMPAQQKAGGRCMLYHFMKLTILILSFTFFNLSCFSQDTLANSKRFPFSDTTLSVVYFANTLALKNMVAVENSKNATIYINKDSIQSFVNRKLIESDYNKKEYNKILLELSRLKDGKIKDLTRLSFSSMNRIVAEQIMIGKAKIYDKQNQVYLTTAYHRIERVISTGYRTFYFSKTDRRYFYSYAEWQGIIPNELMPDIE